MARAGLDRRLARLEAGRRGELPLLVLWQDLGNRELFGSRPLRPGTTQPGELVYYRRSDFDALARSYRLVVVEYEILPPPAI